MTSAPPSKPDHFDDLPLQNTCASKLVEKDRVKRNSSGGETSRPVSDVPCVTCQELEKALTLAENQNEALMRGFSRIVSHIDQVRQIIKTVEELIHERENTPDHIHIPSQDIYIIDPIEVNAIRKDAMKSVDGIYPKGLDLTEVEDKLVRMDEILQEVRESSLNSVDSCFELSSSKRQRPPLARLNTLHTSSLVTSVEMSLPVGDSSFETSQRARAPISHHYSEHIPDDSFHIGSLRRTHSETELSRSVLLMSASTDPLSQYSINSSSQFDQSIPFRSHLMSVLQKQEIPGSVISFDSSVTFGTLQQNMEFNSFVKPLGQGLTGKDDESHQLLGKIKAMEEERWSLLSKNDELNNQNKILWQTIDEMGQDLDCKHLQVQLLSTDIRQATTQLRLAAEMQNELKDLKREREKLREKSSSLEDETKVVKASLVQRLTEMAATNKVLSLDNRRLRNKIVQIQSSSAPHSLTSQNSGLELQSTDFNTKKLKREDTFDEAQLQGALLELDDGNTYVHKEGFLTKQGHKVKTWRRRMFVLDTKNLSYYKTEQPLGVIPLEEITKVQTTHGLTSKPNMFELHRQEGPNKRIYYMSAESQEEMQSWIGIIETLKHAKREQSMKGIEQQNDSTSPNKQAQATANVKYNVVKARSHTSVNAYPPNTSSITMPRIEDSSRLRVTIAEHGGVRNRMFTETGQRRQDIIINIDTSDDEEMDKDLRSPFCTVSSDDEGLKPSGEQYQLSTLHN